MSMNDNIVTKDECRTHLVLVGSVTPVIGRTNPSISAAFALTIKKTTVLAKDLCSINIIVLNIFYSSMEKQARTSYGKYLNLKKKDSFLSF